MKINQSFLFALLTFAPLAAAAEHYVAPNGSANGTGTKDNPWSLTKALGHPSTVKPGDTIWLRGGTYGTGGGTLFDSYLTGTSSQPIILRQYAGERAIINGGLEVNGAWTWFWGFEITNTYAQRTTNQESRQGGVQMFTRGHKAINLIIHDVGHPGIGFWSPVGDGAEIHGCIIWGAGIYDNSWSPIARRGSAVYAQNQSGTRYITDVIAFRNWTDGIDIYTENDYADGFHIEGNIIFDHPEDNMFASGGSNPARRLKMLNNYTYLRPNSEAPSIRLGYGGQYDATVQNNYIGAGVGYALYSYRWPNFTGSGNTLVGKDALFSLMRVSGGSYSWNNNSYFTPSDWQFNLDDKAYYKSPEWKSTTGLDASSTFSKSTPPNKIVVRPNKYEAGRAHIAVFNWSKSGAVTVNLSGVLNAGDEFEIRDAQNFFGAPVASGTFDGNTVIIPMTGTQVAPILGGANHFETTHTGPEFGAFVVLPKSAGSSTPPPPLQVNAGPDQTVSYPGTVTLAGTAGGSGSYTSQWSKVSGPGTTNFANASSPSTTVTFSAAGAYVLRLTVTQGSASVNDTVSINASGDTTAPVISAVAAGSLTQTSAAIAWTTNEASDTQVEYGKTTSLGSATALNTAKTLAHAASLTGLDVGVRYYFRVKSRDAAGNLATSGTLSFTTTTGGGGSGGAPTISQLSVDVTSNSATISWKTNEASDSVVYYGLTNALGQSASASGMVTSHSVTIAGLAGNTRYYYRVSSADAGGARATYYTKYLTTDAGSGGGGGNPAGPNELSFEAESAQLAAPMVALPNGAASGGGYISAASAAGAATFTVNVPTSGTYYLWARVYAPTASTDSFFVSVDGMEDVFDVAEDTWSPSWQWTVLNGRANGNPLTLNPRVLTLSAGNHQIVFRTREANTGLDRIILTRDADFQPSN